MSLCGKLSRLWRSRMHRARTEARRASRRGSWRNRGGPRDLWGPDGLDAYQEAARLERRGPEDEAGPERLRCNCEELLPPIPATRDWPLSAAPELRCKRCGRLWVWSDSRNRWELACYAEAEQEGGSEDE